MAQASPKGKSPYQRYGKRPHRYSDIYARWRTAILSGNAADADKASRDHARRFLHGIASPERRAA